VGRTLTIIAVNYQEKAFEAELAATVFPSNGKTLVRFEDREVTIREGRLADAFAPLQPHVYEVELSSSR
jgi:hypothetical protein